MNWRAAAMLEKPLTVFAVAIDSADDVDRSSCRTLVTLEQAGGAVIERLVQGFEIVLV